MGGSGPGARVERLVQEATEVLRGRVRHTPLEHSPGLSEAVGAETWLKLECLQVTGSFKARGALLRLLRLGPEARARGVCTASAGNHGLGLAWAGRDLRVPVTVFVPTRVDPSKRAGIEALGATVVVGPHPGYDDTEALARQRAAERGWTFVSAFDELEVMAGNGGSVAAEILADLPGARTLVVPVGGGGLAAGAAVAAPDLALVGCQLEACPALALSLERGEAVTHMPPVETLAGGVEGGLGAGPFAFLRDRVAQVALVSEAALRAATVWMLEHHHLLVEPTAAVPVAACLAGLGPVEGPVVVVISGRNVALSTVRALLATGPGTPLVLSDGD